MSYRNKIILIGLVCFVCGVRTGQVGAEKVLFDASVDVYNKLTGQRSGLF